ncbi:MAG: FAD-dependent tricarballylate dehydrogenase TcuA, partial [Chloroflexi bacterium]|nr:FAD-dependent tricarballylate dehydrogenase TcuA [Chloroflexota bacterium]
IPDLSDAEKLQMEVGTYTADQFYDDLMRVTDYRTDSDLADILIRESQPTMRWMRQKGVRFVPLWGRQAFKLEDGKFHFWGGLVLEPIGAGVGLIDALIDISEAEGVEVRYETMAAQLVQDERGRIVGVRAKTKAGYENIPAKAVVLACGGFEANSEMRARYLGPNWDLVKVRGTQYNTGEGIQMALDIGAQPCGHWSGCHAVAWDLNAPPYGDRKITDLFQKHSYPFGIIVNLDGQRFVDEGADIRNYTYAKYGREILRQPKMTAVQIFDAKVTHLLRDEYRIREVTKATANTIEELGERLGIDREGLATTVREFNAAVQPGSFNPTIKDGKRTVGIHPPKANWALPIDTPPFVGHAVTCGITFTFGGLRINTRGQVLDTMDQPIAGLYAAGELVGGLFFDNYPGGTGLTAGAVFGRLAGGSAGEDVKRSA